MDSLVTLYDPEQLQVWVVVPLDKFQLVRPGLPVEVKVEELSERRLSGTILYDIRDKETAIARNTVTVKVGLFRHSRAMFAPLHCLPAPTVAQTALMAAIAEGVQALESPFDKLRPDMIARVRFLSPPTESKETGGEVLRLFVPKRLADTSGGEARIWIVDQAAGRAILRTVVLGQARQGELVEITQGLQPSDKLITSGHQALKPGDRVRIVGEEP